MELSKLWEYTVAATAGIIAGVASSVVQDWEKIQSFLDFIIESFNIK